MASFPNPISPKHRVNSPQYFPIRNNVSPFTPNPNISNIAQSKINSILRFPRKTSYDFLKICECSLNNFSVDNSYNALNILALNTNTWKKHQAIASLINQNLQELIGKMNININLFPVNKLVNISRSLANLGTTNDNFLDSISKKITDEIQNLNSDEISNIAYAFAILRFKSVDLFKAITRRALEIGHENLSYKNLANLAWSFAIIHILFYEEESSFEKLCKINIDIFSGTFLLKVKKDEQKEEINSINIQQIYSSILSLDGDSLCYYYKLETNHFDLFKQHSIKINNDKKSKSSDFHQEVNESLKRIMKRESFETNYFDKGFFLDIVIDKDKKIALETAGSFQFLTNGNIKGSELLRSFILKKWGWTIINVPYIKWNSLKDDEEKDSFLKNKLLEKKVEF